MLSDSKERLRDRRRYTLILLLICAVLAFGIFHIVRMIRSGEYDPTVLLEKPTETAATEPEPSETEPPETENATTEESEPPTEAPATEAEEETETTESNASPSGNIQCSKSHVYIRVNHSQQIILRLSGGLKQSDIVWSTDDENVVDVTEGLITGLQKGTCIVTASCSHEHVEIPVTVREMTVEDGCTYVDGILVANKSYSLPSDYDPGVLPVTQEAFDALAEDAAKEGLDIYVGSDYRTYDFQVTVYNSMVRGYGKEYADNYSARPGHSEHQTGYTIDCNGINNETFADTPEGKWLAEHCHEYGFIIRYPKGKESITGYSYESWHIRYVGVEHATAIYEQGLTLEEYLDVTSVYEDDETNEQIPEDEPEE